MRGQLDGGREVELAAQGCLMAAALVCSMADVVVVIVMSISSTGKSIAIRVTDRCALEPRSIASECERARRSAVGLFPSRECRSLRLVEIRRGTGYPCSPPWACRTGYLPCHPLCTCRATIPGLPGCRRVSSRSAESLFYVSHL